jgi:phosphoglycolate phosphatase
MSLKKPTIVLFDMDGTTVRHLNPALLGALEALDDAAHRAARVLSRIIRRPVATPPLVGMHEGKRKKLLVHRAIHKFRRKEVDEIVEPCPGIYDVLDFLKKHQVPMGLISNGLGKGYGHDILKTFDLEKYYDVVIFREDITRSKPYPDPIITATEQLARPLNEDDVIWYIGDRRKDVMAALAANSYLPCEVQPFAYNLNAVSAILEHNIGVDHIIMAWPDALLKIKALFSERP